MRIIQAPVIQVDTFSFAECGPKTIDINCDGARVLNMAWMVPLTHQGVLKEYQKRLDCPKPTPDSIRVVIVQVNEPESHIYYIAVDDAAGPTVFTDLCNACCGDTPSAPAYVPPALILQDCIECVNADGNRVWNFPMPSNPNDLPFSIVGIIDGAPFPVTPPDSFATPADLLTWLQANIEDLGAWTSAVVGDTPTTVFTFTSPGIGGATCLGLAITLLSAVYCIPIDPSGDPVTIDGLRMQIDSTPTSIVVPLPGGPVTYSTTTPSALIYALQRMLNGLFAINAGPAPQVQYSGLQKPTFLTFEGSNVQAVSTGECLNTFTFAIPTITGGQHFNISGQLFNGVAGDPVPPTGTFATSGAMLTWLNTNQSAYGAWTIVGSNLLLKSHDTYSAAMTITAA